MNRNDVRNIKNLVYCFFTFFVKRWKMRLILFFAKFSFSFNQLKLVNVFAFSNADLLSN